MLRTSFLASLAFALCASGASAATTGSAGNGQAFGNYQSSLAVTYTVTLNGIFPSRQLTDGTNAIGGDDYLASLHMFAGNFAPRGTALAQGQILPISQNTALFALLGTNYGGNGVNNFGLPDIQGRSLIGAGAGAGLSQFSVGQESGRAQVTLTTANLPAHDHDLVGGGSTGMTGGSQAYDAKKPSLAISYLIQTEGVFPGQSGFTGDGFVGQIEAFAGNFTPQGFRAADGSTLSIADNIALFAIIGTTYGGDGVTTFKLPDLQGRSAVGAGQPTDGGQQVSLGQVFGRENITLTEAQMPAHVHTLPGGGTTLPDGSGAAINNYGPSLGLNYIISTSGIFPSRNLTADGVDLAPGGVESTLGQISLFAGAYAPGGWAFANGQLLSIAQNTALFSIIGTQFGGNGTTTFALPDFRGRTAIGTGFSDFGNSFTIGDTTGTNSLTLGINNLPAHTHDVPDPAVNVPEPATWAMLLVGFGLIGGAMRRRGARPAIA